MKEVLMNRNTDSHASEGDVKKRKIDGLSGLGL